MSRWSLLIFRSVCKRSRSKVMLGKGALVFHKHLYLKVRFERIKNFKDINLVQKAGVGAHMHLHVWEYIFSLFRAQEPKAPVTYCDHALSGVRPSSVRLFTFSTSSLEPLDGFWWNFVWMKYSRSLTSVVVFQPDPPRGGSRAGQK